MIMINSLNINDIDHRNDRQDDAESDCNTARGLNLENINTQRSLIIDWLYIPYKKTNILLCSPTAVQSLLNNHKTENKHHDALPLIVIAVELFIIFAQVTRSTRCRLSLIGEANTHTNPVQTSHSLKSIAIWMTID